MHLRAVTNDVRIPRNWTLCPQSSHARATRRKLDAEAISKDGLDQAWLSVLLEGKAIPADIQPLRALAHALRVAPSDFVSAGPSSWTSSQSNHQRHRVA
jgi:DNA-binding Xre family transcriptional regulator